MFVFRVETDDGYGLFHRGRRVEHAGRMPSITRDGGFSEDLITSLFYGRVHYYFAFRSPREAKYWCQADVRENPEEWRHLYLSVYFAPEYHCGNHQVVFNRDKAKLIARFHSTILLHALG